MARGLQAETKYDKLPPSQTVKKTRPTTLVYKIRFHTLKLSRDDDIRDWMDLPFYVSP